MRLSVSASVSRYCALKKSLAGIALASDRVVLPGFEPRQTEPKPVVLPLHHKTILVPHLSAKAMQSYALLSNPPNFAQEILECGLNFPLLPKKNGGVGEIFLFCPGNFAASRIFPAFWAWRAGGGAKKRMSKAILRLACTHSPLSSAVRTRLELATPCVTGRYSNRLNYRTSWSVGLCSPLSLFCVAKLSTIFDSTKYFSKNFSIFFKIVDFWLPKPPLLTLSSQN